MKLFRTLLFWIVLALLGALAAQWLLREPGSVLVRYDGTDYSTTVVGAVAILVGGALVLWLLWVLLSYPFRAVSQHREKRARARLGDGLDAFHRGQYERAEKLLGQAADDASVAASARVAAAHVAVARGDQQRARTYLDGLDDTHAASRALALADLALADQRPTDALVALDTPLAQPLPPRGVLLRAHALAGLGKAADAYGLLGTLRKQQVLPASELDILQSQWAQSMLRDTADANVLASHWEALPKALKTQPAVAAAYADRAVDLRWHDAATKVLEQALDAQWDTGLVDRYGALPLGRIESRQATAERWLRDHPSDPTVLLALARLHRLQGQWPKAEDYLHRVLNSPADGSANAAINAQAWEEFGHGYSAIGDNHRARIAYANALRAMRGDAPLDVDGPSSGSGTASSEPAVAAALPSATPPAIATEERDINGLPRLRP